MQLFQKLKPTLFTRNFSTKPKQIKKILFDKFKINEKNIELYGNYKAKLEPSYIESIKNKKDGKLILVSAMTPTKYGEGKTCTTIGLNDSLCNLGMNSIAAIREPSMGPVFGMKGGATGGGKSQVYPSNDINLHFNGDLHAITSANNLLSSLIDNHIYWGNKLNIDLDNITFTRAVDMNDRVLRNIIINDKKVLRKEKYCITVASEIMAVFCLSENLNQLKQKISNIIVAYSKDSKAITVKDLKAENAITTLLEKAFMPNIVQSHENNPVIIHGGPFANIAHGCNSVIATKTALKMSDCVVTEAGFGSDLGAEKFFNIKCRMHNLNPDLAVIVSTVRAIRHHGNKLDRENVLMNGLKNLFKHKGNITKFNVPVLIVLNKFKDDKKKDIDYIVNYCRSYSLNIIVSEHYEKGSSGSIEMGKAVIDLLNRKDITSRFKPLYDLDKPIIYKINKIANEIYGIKDVKFTKSVLKKIENLEKNDLSNLPICMAKDQYKFNGDRLSDDGDFMIKNITHSAGAGFLVAYSGNIMTMPGLPRKPAAENL